MGRFRGTILKSRKSANDNIADAWMRVIGGAHSPLMRLAKIVRTSQVSVKGGLSMTGKSERAIAGGGECEN